MSETPLHWPDKEPVGDIELEIKYAILFSGIEALSQRIEDLERQLAQLSIGVKLVNQRVNNMDLYLEMTGSSSEAIQAELFTEHPESFS